MTETPADDGYVSSRFPTTPKVPLWIAIKSTGRIGRLSGGGHSNSPVAPTGLRWIQRRCNRGTDLILEAFPLGPTLTLAAAAGTDGRSLRSSRMPFRHTFSNLLPDDTQRSRWEPKQTLPSPAITAATPYARGADQRYSPRQPGMYSLRFDSRVVAGEQVVPDTHIIVRAVDPVVNVARSQQDTRVVAIPAMVGYRGLPVDLVP